MTGGQWRLKPSCELDMTLIQGKDTDSGFGYWFQQSMNEILKAEYKSMWQSEKKEKVIYNSKVNAIGWSIDISIIQYKKSSKMYYNNNHEIKVFELT